MATPVSTQLVTLTEIDAARERIAPHVLRTPLVALSGSGVLLKAESLQPSGAFKLRGAFNTLLRLSPAARARGVVAHSSGNHAVAVAMAAARLGIPATIVMPRDAPSIKLDWTRALGAHVELVGPASSERAERAGQLAKAYGLTPVEPYDARDIIAATGTIALEIIDELGTCEPLEFYVPVSGGGLIAGIATAARLTADNVRVIGVEPDVAADAFASRRAGRRVRLPAEQMARTLADGLRVQIVGALTWPHIEAYVDEIVTVPERELPRAMSRVAQGARLVAEPSAVVPVVAAVEGTGSAGAPPGRRVAILSGGNVDPRLLARALADA
jgi:threonine dehydratase